MAGSSLNAAAYLGRNPVLAAYYGTKSLSSLKLGAFGKPIEPGDPKIVYTENFLGADGSPWPSPPWTTREPELQAAHDDQTTEIHQGAGRMRAGYVYSNNLADLSGLAPLRDSEMYFTFQPNTDGKERYFYAIINGNRQYPAGAGDWYPGDCYCLSFYWGDVSWGEDFPTYAWTTARTASGAEADGDNGFAGNVSSDRRWAVRLQRVGTILRFKVWDAGTVEPVDWFENEIPTAYQGWTGRPGFSFASGGGDVLWMDIRDLQVRNLS